MGAYPMTAAARLPRWTPHRRNILLTYLFFAYFSIVFQGILYAGGITGIVGLKYSLIYSLLWLLVPLWLPSLTRAWMWGVGFILWACSLVKLGYLSIYGQELSQSVFFTIFETNLMEGTEFFEMYFRWWMIPLLILYTLPPLWILKHVKPMPPSRRAKRWITALVAVSFMEPILVHANLHNEGAAGILDPGTRKIVSRISAVTPWQLVVGYSQYRTQLHNVEKLLASVGGRDEVLARVSLADRERRQTYVLVIGESTDRQRMGLYGYYRDTTPELSRMRDELFVFDDVITPRPFTIEALWQALTLADQQRIDWLYDKPNIITLMKSVGFRVTWITNQQTATERNTLLTALSKLADEQVYLNNQRRQSARQLDSVVLDPFRKALDAPAEKKFIIVHLLGTHSKYQYRYPEDYARFDGSDDTPVNLTAYQAGIYNSYDNAILYHDHVLASIIDAYKATDPYGVLMYFSDHGEEVYDFRDFQGRNEADPSTYMYTVPFIIAPSRRWAEARGVGDWDAYEGRPYSTESVIHTWCDLAALRFEMCDAGKSLVSPRFAYGPRLIGDPYKPSSLRDYNEVLGPGASGRKLLSQGEPRGSGPPPASTLN